MGAVFSAAETWVSLHLFLFWNYLGHISYRSAQTDLSRFTEDDPLTQLWRQHIYPTLEVFFFRFFQCFPEFVEHPNLFGWGVVCLLFKNWLYAI